MCIYVDIFGGVGIEKNIWRYISGIQSKKWMSEISNNLYLGKRPTQIQCLLKFSLKLV